MPKSGSRRNLLNAWMVCAGLVFACGPATETKPRDDGRGHDGGNVPDPLDGGANPTDSGALEARGRVTGRVFDQRSLRPIAGVQVHTPDGQIAVTDAQGVFSADLDTLGHTALTFHALGYARGIEPTSIAQDEITYLEAQLLPVDGMAMVSSDKGGAVNGTGGASVEFGANAFKHKDGSPVKGEVIVELTALDPSTPEGLRAFPGSFAAMSKDGKLGQLITVVPMDITARQGDKVLDIASDTKAVVHFPIANPDTAPATIALWSLSETTGEWVEEGVAEKIFDAASRSYVYRGSIQHMSWWNCDSFARITCIRGCAKRSDGTAVPQARTLAEGIDFNNIGEGYTGPNGCFAEDVPAGGQVRIRVQSALGVSEARVVSASDVELRAKDNPAACQDVGTFIIDTMPMMEGCPAGLSECGESCVDFGSSAQNCGTCGNVCADGASCVGGTCSCKASELSCDGVCTNVRDSNRNCGACGNACGKGAECVEGSCVQVACPAGTIQCLGGCFNGESCCGDATCDEGAGENAGSCSADCGQPSVCGDGTCGNAETLVNCAADCSVCGDKVCSGTETVASCATDCFLCGDSKCTGPETHQACPSDCACDGFACGDGQCITKLKASCDGTEDCRNGFDEDNCTTTSCGDKTCAADESPASCPADCVGCGDGKCGAGESAQTCELDCRSSCGDDYCSPSEKANFDFFGTCPEDCGSCGDSYCTWEEQYSDSCSADCGSCGDEVCSDFEWLQHSCESDCDYGGTGEIGDFCWENDECRSGLSCREEVCAEPGLEGEGCDDEDKDDEDCSAGLACVSELCIERAGLDGLCFERSDCQSEWVCSNEKCVEPAQVGESCLSFGSGEDGGCATGLVCVVSYDSELDYQALCEDPTVAGSACNYDMHCANDRTCLRGDESMVGICRDRGTAGMSCFDAADCVSGLGCFAGQCVAGAQPGAPCDIEIDYSTDEYTPGYEGDDSDCAEGLVCVWFRETQSASCALLGEVGTACGEYADCADELNCIYGTAAQGKCSADRNLGEVCDFASDCTSGLVCVHEVTGGTCSVPGELGDACDNEDDCVEGLACVAHQCAARSPTGGACEMLTWQPWSNGDSQYESTYPRTGGGSGPGEGTGGGAVPGEDSGTGGSPEVDGDSPAPGSGQLYGDHSDCIDGDECWNGICTAPGELGYSCYSETECSGDLICRDEHCLPLGQAGDDCDWQEDADCAVGLSCDEGICATAGGPFASCYGDDPCDAGLVCRGERCGEPAQLGESCEYWWWTPSGYNTGCDVGLSCVDKLCVAEGSLGTFCDAASPCLTGLVCSSSEECVLPRAEGEDCWDAPCAAGLVCEDSMYTCTPPAQLGESCSSIPCDAELTCGYDRTCQPTPGAGDSCADAPCGDGYVCEYQNETCVSPSSLGEDCSYVACEDGLTCAFDQSADSYLCRMPAQEGESCNEVSCGSGLRCEYSDSAQDYLCVSMLFTCDDGEVIPVYWKCDAYDDCSQGEDELGCSSTGP